MPIKDPSILLAKRSLNPTEDSPLLAFEGRVGAVVLDNEFFATSPNMDIVYQPPQRKRMTYKTDLRLGEDDILLWPQFFIEEYCHFAAIPRCPMDLTSSHPQYIMFHPIRDIDFELSQGSFRGLGKLKYSLLNAAVEYIKSTINPQFEQVSKMTANKIFTHLHSFIHRSLINLRSLPMTRRQALFIFADLQRHLLEFTAAFNYMTKYRPLLKGEGEPAKSVDDVIGAFTTKLSVCEGFLRAGIPVWLIRPVSLAGSVRVDTVVDPLKPGDILCLKDDFLKYSVSFMGSPSDAKKYLVFGHYSLNFLSYGDVFDSQALHPRHLPPASKPVQKTRFQPYKKFKPSTLNATSAGRNKFVDPISPLLPTAHPSWSSALHLVDTGVVFESELGYPLPEPCLFVTVGGEDRQALYFYNWLKYRPILQLRLTVEPGPIRNQLWRTLLSLPADNNPSSLSSSSSVMPASLTKPAKNRKLVQDMLKACLEFDKELSIDHEAISRPTWLGQEINSDRPPPIPIAQQILWELSELIFRYELYSLDRHAHVEAGPGLPRLTLITRCFPGHSMLVVDLEFSGQGLAANNWKCRIPYLVALWDVMKSWAGFNVLQDVEDHSQQNILLLEVALLKFYTQTFYNTFGRAASVPRCI